MAALAQGVQSLMTIASSSLSLTASWSALRFRIKPSAFARLFPTRGKASASCSSTRCDALARHAGTDELDAILNLASRFVPADR